MAWHLQRRQAAHGSRACSSPHSHERRQPYSNLIPSPHQQQPPESEQKGKSLPPPGHELSLAGVPKPAMTAISPSTANPSPTTAASRSKLPTIISRAESDRGLSTRRAARTGSLDPLSDRATANLVRRTLCPQQRNDKDREPPIEELLPPLTSRNDVDLQLYAIISIILREFVQSWYGKITTDETFVAEVVHVVAHCTRALEQRLRKVDLESLMLDEIPDLLNKHITGKGPRPTRIQID